MHKRFLSDHSMVFYPHFLHLQFPLQYINNTELRVGAKGSIARMVQEALLQCRRCVIITLNLNSLTLARVDILEPQGRDKTKEDCCLHALLAQKHV